MKRDGYGWKEEEEEGSEVPEVRRGPSKPGTREPRGKFLTYSSDGAPFFLSKTRKRDVAWSKNVVLLLCLHRWKSMNVRLFTFTVFTLEEFCYDDKSQCHSSVCLPGDVKKLSWHLNICCCYSREWSARRSIGWRRLEEKKMMKKLKKNKKRKREKTRHWRRMRQPQRNPPHAHLSPPRPHARTPYTSCRYDEDRAPGYIHRQALASFRSV